jgi:hypothetical protein
MLFEGRTPAPTAGAASRPMMCKCNLVTGVALLSCGLDMGFAHSTTVIDKLELRFQELNQLQSLISDV